MICVHFELCLKGQNKLTKRLVRGVKMLRAIYGFGDASGSGFGATNNRELLILANVISCMEQDGDLEGAEIFIFIDNSTAGRAFFKGSLTSRILHFLIRQLRVSYYR